MANDILPKSGIYCIRNLSHGKVYVGQSNNCKKRNREHFSQLKNNKHCCIRLQRAYIKYGESNFRFEVMEFCQIDTLTEREQFYMDAARYVGLYNTAPAAGSLRGITKTPEQRLKISIANKGKKKTPEMCAAMSALRKGRKRSAESIRKGIEARTGAKLTQATKDKISAAHIARNTSPGYVSHNLGREFTPEHRAKIGESRRGIKHSAEAKANISAGRRGIIPIFANPEARMAKIIAANKLRGTSAEKRAEVLRLVEQGAKRVEVATIMHLSRHTIGRMVSGEQRIETPREVEIPRTPRQQRRNA